MNTRSKASFVILAVMVIVSVLLSSCGAKPTAAPTSAPVQPATSAPATAAPVATTAPSGESVTVTVWAHDEAMIQFAKPKFEALHPNIKIDLLIIPSPDDFFTKLDTAIAADQVPDIAQIPTNNDIQAGHVMDLDPFMAQEGWSLDSFPESIKAAPEGGAVLNGKIYVAPTNMYVWGMLINKDLFKAAGLPELTPTSVITYDDWLTYARAINKPSDAQASRVWGSAYLYPSWNAMGMSDPYILGPDGKTCSGNSSDWQHFFEIQETAFNEGLTVESSSSQTGNADTFDLFTQGKVGMIYGSQSDLLAAKQKGINVALVGQPVAIKGQTHNSGSYIVGYSIMEKAAHPTEAWEFLKYILTDSSLDASLNAPDSLTGLRGALPALKTEAAKWQTMLTPEDAASLSAVSVLIDNATVPPFSPDYYGALAPYDDAWTAISQQGADIKTTLDSATAQCQQLDNDAWDTWNSLK